MSQIETIISTVFGAGLFINALLFVPQALKLFRNKTSDEVSLIMFTGFCFMQLSAILYGQIHDDYILMSGYGLSLLTCGTVTTLAIFYRQKSKRDSRESMSTHAD